VNAGDGPGTLSSSGGGGSASGYLQRVSNWWKTFKQVDTKKLAVRLNQCAAQEANKASISRLFGNGKIAQYALGNTLSSLSQLAVGPGRIN
jgi:hypothetical protein